MANLDSSDDLLSPNGLNPARLFLNSSSYSYVQAKTSGLNANLIHIIDYFKPRDIGLSNDQYARFVGVEPPIEQIGKPSHNGFINLIQYKRGAYLTYAVLKSSIEPKSDNLMYEYMVGQYVNKLNKRFPCFVETYGYYKYKDNQAWEYLKNNIKKPNMLAITKGLELQHKIDYAVACENSDQLAILIQYLPNITAIYWKLLNEDFLKKELANVLFQIYMPLSVLAGSFTHHDLHSGNVNVCEPAEDSYIQFHYHMVDGEVCSFKSKYIAKMIDYGRSYFNDKEAGIDSKKIYSEICMQPKCWPRGITKGFQFMVDNVRFPNKHYWINSQKRNESHDLRLLSDVKRLTTENGTYQDLPEKLQNLLGKLTYNHMYGTPECEKGFPCIKNVHDAASTLRDIISSPSVIGLNEAAFYGKKKLGELHIYCTGPDSTNMEFIDFQEKKERFFQKDKTSVPEPVRTKKFPEDFPNPNPNPKMSFQEKADYYKTRVWTPVQRKEFPPDFPNPNPNPNRAKISRTSSPDVPKQTKKVKTFAEMAKEVQTSYPDGHPNFIPPKVSMETNALTNKTADENTVRALFPRNFGIPKNR